MKSIAVANYFIQKTQDARRAITPMKCMKLVIIAHGWHLAKTGKPLLSEPVLAWKYGPGISTLYTEIKEYKDKPIPGLLRKKILGLIPSVSPAPIAGDVDHPLSTESQDLLDQVWDSCGFQDAITLANEFNAPDGLFSRVRKEFEEGSRSSKKIPNEIFIEHFGPILRAPKRCAV